MKRRLFCLVALVCSAGLSLAAVRAADKFNKVLEIGADAPDWSAIPGTDDKEHSLKDLEEKKAVVMVFTCNHCPVAVMYEDRLVELQKAYEEKGVQVVAVNVQDGEADNLPAMKQRAEQKGFNFPYLFDISQESGKAYGASVTPHVFLLDGDRKIAYMGAIDDNPSAADKVKTHYLSDAIDAVLAGSQPQTTSTRPAGCGIHYEKK